MLLPENVPTGPRKRWAIAPLTVERPEVVAAVPVVHDERVVEGQDRGVDLDVPGTAVVVAVGVVVAPVVDRVVDAHEVVRDQAPEHGGRVGALEVVHDDDVVVGADRDVLAVGAGHAHVAAARRRRVHLLARVAGGAARALHVDDPAGRQRLGHRAAVVGHVHGGPVEHDRRLTREHVAGVGRSLELRVRLRHRQDPAGVLERADEVRGASAAA